MYTKEQIKTLEEMGMVEQFNLAVNSGFKRNTTREMNEKVLDIYKQASGAKDYTPNLNCKGCVFDLFRRAGELFFKQLKETEVLDTVFSVESDEPKEEKKVKQIKVVAKTKKTKK